MTMKFYLFALFIALVAFGGTSFIMRDRQATATTTQPSLQSPNRPPDSREEKGRRQEGYSGEDSFGERAHRPLSALCVLKVARASAPSWYNASLKVP